MTRPAPNEPVISLDIDWATDDQIDAVAERLRRRGVRATWFVTHHSPAVDRLRSEPDLFELGLHPNFLPGSSHGGSPEEVISHCRNLVPDSTSLRTHGLVQSSRLLHQILELFPQRAEGSIYLGHAAQAQPVDYYWNGLHTVRTPTVWADDVETMRPEPIWEIEALRRVCRGLLLLTFHPIHLVLNSRDLRAYERYKRRRASGEPTSLEELAPLRASGDGSASMFESALETLEKLGGGRTLRGLVDSYLAKGWDPQP